MHFFFQFLYITISDLVHVFFFVFVVVNFVSSAIFFTSSVRANTTTKFNAIYLIDIRSDTFSFAQSISYLSFVFFVVASSIICNASYMLDVVLFQLHFYCSCDISNWCNITILCLLKWILNLLCVHVWVSWFVSILFAFYVFFYSVLKMLQFDFCDLVS